MAIEKMREDESSEGVSRRDFMRNTFVGAVGALALVGLDKTEAMAVEPGNESTPTSSSSTPSAAGTAKTAEMKIEDVLRVAREKLYPRCRVCPECDGVACSGEVPGMGGIGSGKSFKNNYAALQKIELNMRTFHDIKKVDTSVTLFGEKIALPVMSGATGGVTYNMGLNGKMTDEEYIDALLGGCRLGGT